MNAIFRGRCHRIVEELFKDLSLDSDLRAEIKSKRLFEWSIYMESNVPRSVFALLNGQEPPTLNEWLTVEPMFTNNMGVYLIVSIDPDSNSPPLFFTGFTLDHNWLDDTSCTAFFEE